MPALMLNDHRVDDTISEEDLQAQLRSHYHNFKGKPATCLCQPVPPRMYIANVGDRFILKRWPGSGHEHAANCDRYEPPLEASGISKLIGHAIEEDPNTGNVSLALGFALRRSPRQVEDIKKLVEKGQEAEIREGPAHQSNARLQLRATLHYFWEGTKLNQWKPYMTGQRNWRFIQSTLKEYSKHILTKGHVLANKLYIPEPFIKENKEQIRMRRRAFFQQVASNKASRDLLMFLFEIKSHERVEGGYAITAKNVPDDLFYMSEDSFKVMMIRYQNEFGMLKREQERKSDATDPPNHLIALGTMSVKESGYTTIEDITVMMCTHNWIPIADEIDDIIVKYATSQRRHFMKPLRYNMGPGSAIASIIYLDTPDKGTSVWVVKANDSEALIERRDDAIAANRTHSVLLDLGQGDSISDVLDAIPRINP